MNRFVAVFALALVIPASANAQSYFTNCISNTGNDATLIVDASGNHILGNGSFAAGDEIGIYTEDGQCVGADVWTGQNFAIPIWGDEPLRSDKSGLLADETFMIRVWDKSADKLYGTSYGTVTFELETAPPFRASPTYQPNALYMTTKIEALGTSKKGRDKVRTKGKKNRTTEAGSNSAAMFTISRTGPFNDGLDVGFTLTGNAVNGTDYEALPTIVTFSPGEKTAYVILRPIADDITEGEETVTLTLQSAAAYDLVSNEISASLTIDDAVTALGTSIDESPTDFMLAAPYPNPFISGTTIRFHTSETQIVRVDVYNVIGKKVAAIFDGTVQAGIAYDFTFNADGLPDGLYMIKATGKQTTVRSATLQR